MEEQKITDSDDDQNSFDFSSDAEDEKIMKSSNYKNKEEFYHKQGEFWKKQTKTNDGVLGGFAQVHD